MPRVAASGVGDEVMTSGTTVTSHSSEKTPPTYQRPAARVRSDVSGAGDEPERMSHPGPPNSSRVSVTTLTVGRSDALGVAPERPRRARDEHGQPHQRVHEPQRVEPFAGER